MNTKKTLIIGLFLISILFLPIVTHAQESRIEDLTWLAGCWESNNKTKDLLISEQWMTPAGGAMLGMGRTVRGGSMIDFEFLRIEKKDGVLSYLARPKEAATDTPFKLVRSGPFEAVFENLGHDFPQRIMYKRDGEKLTARIEGTMAGKLKGIDFPMTKAGCN